VAGRAGELAGAGGLARKSTANGGNREFGLCHAGGRCIFVGGVKTVAIIPKENIEQVLAATAIEELIGSYVQLKRAGAQFRANCPFHNEKTPSFYVNPVSQRFHCFGCGAGGDAIAFVRDYENLPFTEALRKLAGRAGVQLSEVADDPEADRNRKLRGRLLDLHREAAAFFHQRLLSEPAAAHAREYLKSRGFGREMAVNWLVGWMPEQPQVFLEWARSRKFSGRELVNSGLASLRNEQRPNDGIYVRFRDRLMFPIRNEIGDVIAFSGRQLREDKNSGKYINSPETAIFKKSGVLFGLDRAKKPILREKAALLCEGQIDAISCHELGIDHAVAPLGTALTQQHARLLKRYTGSLLLCYDGDRAGVAAAERAFREAVPEGLAVRVAELPAGDDPDTFLKKHGVDAFRELLGNAKEFFDFKLERAKAEGEMDGAAGRSALATKCAELLALIGDHVTRDQQVNVVANHLQMSSSALREAISREVKRSRGRAPREEAEAASERVAPSALHRTVAFLCHLALSSGPAQHVLGEQFETLHEAKQWVEGIDLLETILGAAPDPASNAAVNAFLATLPEPDRLALAGSSAMEGAPADGVQAAEHGIALLSAMVLQRRDAAVKAALKEPGLAAERMIQLLGEAKEISALLRGIGQRSEFDDDLPAATFKEKVPWKKWEDRKKA
jgi:DNA primase